MHLLPGSHMAPQNKPTQVVNSHCGSEKKKGGTAANFDISKGGRKDCANFFKALSFYI